MKKTKLIIAREFNERVRKKSFIITTLLMPVLMVALMVAPSLIALYGGGQKRIVVVDRSGFVSPRLVSGGDILFEDQSQLTKTEACSRYNEDSGAYGILYIGRDVEMRDSVQFIANSSSTLAIEQNIAVQIRGIVERHKLQERYNIEDLEQKLASVATPIELHTFINDGTGNEASMQSTSSGMSSALGLVLGMILYMVIVLYGQMVLTSVAEEKSSRVLDVMVTSCTPFEIMMGKILGIASVALLQITIWAVLVISASKFLIPVLLTGDAAATNDIMMQSLVGTLGDTGYIAMLFAYIILFMLGGFLLYASIYAAAGSAVDSVQEGQQFNNVIVIPIVLGLIVMTSVFNDPNSSVAFWFSMIPFTSPVVMIARIPFGIPLWEIATSLVLLYTTFVITTWLAAKIYRIGIFMHGKRPSPRELLRWLRMR